MVYQWTKKLQSLLFPPTCLLCGALGDGDRDLCGGCLRDLPLNTPSCRRCALPLGAATVAPCGDCQRRPPAFDAARAAYLYDYPLDYLIKALKYQGRLSVARLLGEVLAETLADEPRPDCIIPIPLHPSRLRQRGFNQSVELARPVARRLGVPVVVDCLRRLRPTLPQVGQDARERRANLRGAFGVHGAPPPRVALLDDVVTTGSTVDEAARTLRAAGVEEIWVWAVARTAGQLESEKNEH